ncbi:hypothetical protein BD311DRAFT_238120 [Dichomitus squalens]|uniref:Uncharacterized protein n=1 Tax=Dichomitus squalens TaxID=114155 RepID=A0A4Q9MS15_9APHY|nr:hypothetical protein BD311DRAFT_238120 [Dichomitus squalens]
MLFQDNVRIGCIPRFVELNGLPFLSLAPILRYPPCLSQEWGLLDCAYYKDTASRLHPNLHPVKSDVLHLARELIRTPTCQLSTLRRKDKVPSSLFPDVALKVFPDFLKRDQRGLQVIWKNEVTSTRVRQIRAAVPRGLGIRHMWASSLVRRK